MPTFRLNFVSFRIRAAICMQQAIRHRYMPGKIAKARTFWISAQLWLRVLRISSSGRCVSALSADVRSRGGLWLRTEVRLPGNMEFNMAAFSDPPYGNHMEKSIYRGNGVPVADESSDTAVSRGLC